MGLDQYLRRRVYVSHYDEAPSLKITGLKSKIDPKKVVYIIEEAGYWRKANAIHKWFVENVQNGVDDCGDYEVSEGQMEQLLKIVKTVLAHSELIDGDVINGYKIEAGGKKTPIIEKGKTIKDPTVAKTLLPNENGFFFGSQEYDEGYIQDLQDTEKFLEAALADDEGEYEYHSSW